jgi:type I restriction enzyme S subunit
MIGLPTIVVGELMKSGEASLQTGPFGTQLKASDYVEEGVPVINVRNIGHGRIRDEKLEYLNERMADKLHAHRLRRGDIVFGRKGAVDRHLLVDETTEGWIQGSDCLRLRIESQRVFPPFVSFYFDTKGHKDWMDALCSFGATMTSLNQDIVSRITLPFPSYAAQKKIAAVLSAYDELMENNRRRIALLEKLAEEIYREWFVRLRFPGHENVKLVKGVPEGWTVRPFPEVVDINPTERIDKEEERPFVAMEQLSLTSLYFTHNERRKGHVGPKFRNWDVLFPRITPSVENGKRGLVLTLTDGEVAQGSTEFIVFREKVLTAEHIYFLSVSEGFRTNAELSMTGASGRQRVQEQCFTQFLVKTPPPALREKFTSVVRPMVSQIHLLSTQSEALQRTRDLLLPRLISGKLSVEELDIQFPPGMAAE